MKAYERTRDKLRALEKESPAIEDFLGVLLDLRDDIQDDGVYLEDLEIRDGAALVQRLRSAGLLLMDIAAKNREKIAEADKHGRLAERLHALETIESDLDKQAESIKAREEQLQKRQTDAKERRGQLGRRRAELETKEKEIEALRRDMERLDRECGEIERVSLEKLKQEKSQAEDRRTSLEQTLAEARGQLEAIEESCRNAREQQAALKQKIQNEKRSCDDLSRSLQADRDQLAGAQKEKEALERRRLEHRSAYEQLHKEQEMLSAEVKHWQEEVTRLRAVIAQTDPEKLKEETSRLQREKNEREQALRRTEEAYKTAKTEAAAAEQRRAAAEQELKKAEEKRSEEEEKNKTLSEKRRQCMKNTEELRLDNLDAQNYLDGEGKEELSRAKTESLRLEEETGRMQEDIRKTVRLNGEKSDELKRRAEEYNRLCEERKTLLEKERELLQDTEHVNRELSRLLERKRKEEETNEKNRETLSNTEKELKSEFEKLSRLKIDQDRELERMNARLKKFSQAKRELFRDLSYIESEKYEQKKDELEAQLNDLRKSLKDFSKFYEKLCGLINGDNMD